MVQSAVTFLADPNVQSSPFSQRISFLESKGLTSQEIDLALSQAAHSGGAGGPSAVAHARGGGVPPPGAYPMVPAYPPMQPPRRDWRDWFIMGVVSGTVGYGLIALARKYLYPHLQPPNKTALETDMDELTAKYDEVAEHLDELDQTTDAMRQGLEQHQAEITKSVEGVNSLVQDTRAREEQRDKEFEQLRDEIEQIRSELGQMFRRTRESQANSLIDLQGELKSLRSLLVSRVGSGAQANGASNGAGDGTGSPDTQQRPAPKIPAWQLEDPAEEGKASS